MFNDRKRFTNRLKELIAKKVSLWRWLPLLVWLGISTGTLLLWQALADRDLNTKKRLVEFAAASIKQEVNTQMRNRFQALERMKQRWISREGTPKVEWEVDAQKYLRDYPGFQAIEWIDPDFYVRWIVPLAGNEAAQNLNLAFEPRRKVALEKARQKHTLTVTRTIDLVQGGKGFLVYVPIFLEESKTNETPDYRKNSFDGFILGVFRIKSLLDKLLDDNVAPGYALAIFDGKEEIYRRSFSENSRQMETQWTQEAEINFEGVTWQLKVWKTSELLTAEQSLLPRFVLAGGLVVAVLGANTVYLAQTAQRRTQQVKTINQKLTQEITERQKASSTLREKESTLRSFFNSSTLMMGIVELVDDNILHIADNEATAQFFGITPQAMSNRLASSLGVPPAEVSKWIQHYHESQKTGSPVNFEYPHRTENSTRWLSATVCPIVQTKGMRARFSYIVEDITVRKQAETILQQTKKELEILVAERTAALNQVNESLKWELGERCQAEANLKEFSAQLQRTNRELQNFAYIVSHDLQEPLRKMKNFSQLLARECQGQLTDNEKVQRYLDYIIDAAERQRNLIQALLDYSRLGNNDSTKVSIDLGAVVEKVLKDLSLPIAETQATVMVSDLPTVQASATQMAQLFLNLIGNGIKFQGDAPPRIQIEAQLQPEEWLISVKDNGIGIKPQYAERIFQIFQRLHSRSEYPGTGIGLAICRKIVESHSGQIWVVSELGQGSTFYLTLPVSLLPSKDNLHLDKLS